MRLFDSLTNMLSGMGGIKAKASASVYSYSPLEPGELEAAFRGSWLARKVIEIPAMDMCRAGRLWQAEADQIEAIEAEETRLGLYQKRLHAKTMARLYGGAAILISDGTDQLGEELRPERVPAGGIQFLTVMTARQLQAGEIETDPLSPWFGQPSSYSIQTARAGQVRVHPSRLVRYLGNPAPDAAYASARGWADSILETVHQALKDAEGAATNVAELTHEAKIDVFRIPNLMQFASDPEYEARFLRRMSLAASAKSLYNKLILDKDEEYEQKSVSFGSLPEVLDRFLQIASGAADIPATRLLGQAPAGMNATGESDLRNYYDRISAGQELEFRPAESILDECLIRSALGTRPPEIHYKFAPLWQLGDKDRAEVNLKNAQAFQIDVNAGVFPDSAMAKARQNQIVELGVYPGFEAAIDEAGKEGDDIDFGEKAEEPEVPIVPSPVTRMQAAANDAAPRTLYVRRNVLNAASVLAWARAQGFETTLSADDLHVTIAFSREPLDWMATGESWQSELKVPAGGPRLMEQFGEATVLLFNASELRWRHDAIKDAGASWDHPEYQPHITISYGFKGDLAKVEPYQGEIVLGPEIFEEVKEDWQAGIEEG